LTFSGRLGISQWLLPLWPWAWGGLVLSGVVSITYLASFTIEHLKGRKKRNRISFVADDFNHGWSKQHETEMNLRICGTITFSGDSQQLLILRVFLKGTKQIGGMMPQVIYPNSSAICSSDLWFDEGSPLKVLIDLRLTPVIGKPKEELKAELILQDNLNRKFSVGKVVFPYIG
jgi:hypothetical protein